MLGPTLNDDIAWSGLLTDDDCEPDELWFCILSLRSRSSAASLPLRFETRVTAPFGGDDTFVGPDVFADLVNGGDLGTAWLLLLGILGYRIPEMGEP